ncbi:purine-cytosine permease family protein [Paracoccus fistulariae]|uniref:Cytosine permease n=1 Tax=Paracoccus fistulariae TaxID=658446 RepID=A0ABY7SJ26_9RHOB|nr:cytosine permease [Paracoccus fistulariae]MDB6182202.1 cytosine permease [Paracoccus fistulariae]WCR06578.1 cytosine permease [Paracoccus fistulariae]
MQESRDPNDTGSDFALETRTIGPIPENERFGSVRDLFGIWFGMNMSPLTVVTGALATLGLGLPIGWAILAIVLGNVVGGVVMALHAAQGPQLGVPQLLQARGQFGMYGAAIIAVLAVGMFIGFFASNLVIIAQAFGSILPDVDSTLVLILATLTSLIVASIGYKVLRWVTIASALIVGSLVALSFLWIFVINDTATYDWSGGQFTLPGFLSMFAIGAVWQIAYSPYVSDYSRYMPADTGAKGAFWGTYGGCVTSSVLLMVLGASVGAITRSEDTMSALNSLIGSAGPVVLLGFALATAAYNSVNTYCSALCALSVAETFRPGWMPGLTSRLVVTVAIHICGLAIALAAQSNFLAFFYDFITWMLYILIPWSAINLVDYYVVRRGHYAVNEFFIPGGGRYGNWNVVALTLYVIGVAVQLPFVATGAYTGFLVDDLGGVDIAWIVGLIVSGGAYYLIARRSAPQQDHEQPSLQTGEVAK